MLPYSESIWQEYQAGSCFLDRDAIGVMPVKNRIISVNIIYASELDGFSVLSRCLDLYNIECKGERLYGMSSGGLNIQVIDPEQTLEVLAVKNLPDVSLPMTITITDETGFFWQDTTTELTYYRKWNVV